MKNLLFILILAVSLMPATTHAAAFDDIGALIFRDFLKVSSYPSAPFTGNIINDLVMFFFIPTVFIVIIIYSITGRMFANARIRLLLGIALYLFIVFGGYFTMFMLLAGPYFLFLVVIIGLFLYFASHFGIRPGGGGATLPGTALGGAATGERKQEAEVVNNLHSLGRQLDEAVGELKKLHQQVDDAQKDSKTNPAAATTAATLSYELATQRAHVNSLQSQFRAAEMDAARFRHLHEVSSSLSAIRNRFSEAGRYMK